MQQSTLRESKWKSIVRQCGSLWHCEKYDHQSFYRGKIKSWKKYYKYQWQTKKEQKTSLVK